MDYSLVIPFYNEEGSLRELHRQLTAVIAAMGSYEILFVDDGSTDGSLAIAEQLYHEDAHMSVMQLRRNFGKSVALAAGFARARGNIVITLDADLQDEPKEIPALVAMLNTADLVVGWKAVRHDPWTKTFPSHIFNGIARSLFRLQLHDLNSGLKVMRADVAHGIALYGELHRFVPVLAHIQGFRVAEKSVEHHERRFGKSKYGWKRFVRGSFDLLTMSFMLRFKNSPMHLFGTLGALTTLLGIVIGIYLSVLHFLGQTIGDRPLLMLGILCIIAGLQFFFTGLIAELIATQEHRVAPIRSVLSHDDEHRS